MADESSAPRIRVIRVSRPLIDEFFRDGWKEGATLSMGIPENFQIINVAMEERAVVFWFAPRCDSEKVYAVDDTAPIFTRKTEA